MHLSHLLAVRCIFSDRYTTLGAVNVGRDIMTRKRVAQNAIEPNIWRFAFVAVQKIQLGKTKLENNKT